MEQAYARVDGGGPEPELGRGTCPGAPGGDGTAATQLAGRSSRWVRALLPACGALVIYLAATAAVLGIAWLCWPGRGLETVIARVLLGTWLPGIAVLGLLPRLIRAGSRKSVAVGLLLGMVLVGLALGGAALGVAVGFRVI